MSSVSTKNRKRSDYGYMLEYRLRWADDDVYRHVNNSQYNFYYDSIINAYLMERCGLRATISEQHGLVVHSENDFYASIAFPAVAELGLRVNKLGKSSVTYEIALFERGVDAVKSVGQIVHVFVERDSGRPSSQGMNDQYRKGLEAILVKESSKL